ncbi:MAG: Fe-S cluster assembly protein HesB, partial [Candidatus Thorarchaeota archaeon]
MELDTKSVKFFQHKVMNWWSKNARELPWRVNPSPYEVLISEVMLQQTQVSRVVPKYLEFLNEFPAIEDLASANTKQLLTVWSGLGYNRRALWLKEAAAEIVEQGVFPTEVDDLRKLKGIGPYTSRSILIFAFNKDLATVDTNIRRIFIALGFAKEDSSEKELQEIADALLLKGRSSDWHNALMDYGSAVLTSSSTGIEPISKQP